jgi:radical SAM superfamily enzyme YgiQ (UPF0313 family)
VDILVINPNREQMPWPVMPVGACVVASALERAGHATRFLDLTFSKHPAKDVARAIAQRTPELVAIGIRNIDNCNFEAPLFYLPEIRDEVVRPIRELAPRSTVLVGGAAVNVAPGDVLDYLGADLALVGDGENACIDLVRALEHGDPPDSVVGVLTRRGPRPALPILDTGRRGRGEPPRGRALSSFTRPVWSQAFRWIDSARYAARGTPYPIQTKRGCALKCAYCVYNNIEGHAYRLRDPENIVDELREVAAHGIRHVELVDSTFNLPLHHARAVCEALERAELPLELSTMGLNPAGVSVELVRAMKRAGFTSLMCTPETASEVTLQTLQKGFNKAALVRTARALAAEKMPTYWFFMLGAPGETVASVKETLAFCAEHVPATDMVLFSTGIRVYSGTPLEAHCKQTGWFDADDPLFEPSWYLSPELDLGELYELLVSAAAAHPNWMTNAETVLSPVFAGLMKSAFRAIGWRGPFWLHLPKLFQLSARFGARQKGLRKTAEDLRRIQRIQNRSSRLDNAPLRS